MSQSGIRTSMHVKKAKPNSHPPVVVLPYSGEDLMYKPLRKSFLDTKIIMDFGGKWFFLWIVIILRPNGNPSLLVTNKILQLTLSDDPWTAGASCKGLI